MASHPTIRQERRLDRRRKVQADAELNGERLKIIDLSLAGLGGFMPVFLVADFVDSIGKPIMPGLVLPSGKLLSVSAKLIHLSKYDGRFGIQFLGLNEKQYAAIKPIITGRKT